MSTQKRSHFKTAASLALLALALGLSGCAAPYGSNTYASSVYDGSSAATGTSSSGVQISPTSITVAPGGTVNFTASGGAGGYRFSLYGTAVGSINSSSGVYTAPSNATTAYVQVSDLSGDVAFATVTTGSSSSSDTSGSTGSTSRNPITLSPQNPTVAMGGSLVFSAYGGLPPYTYSITSGTGTLSGPTFLAPQSVQTDQITVTDSAGQSVSTTITITTNTPKSLPVYQYYKSSTGQHIFTLSQSDPYVYGYGYQGVAFRVLASAPVDMSSVALYRCRNQAGKDFISNQSNCEGYQSSYPMSLMGYIYYDSTTDNTTALYRYNNLNNGDILTTTSSAQPSSYSYRGTFGYAPLQ